MGRLVASLAAGLLACATVAAPAAGPLELGRVCDELRGLDVNADGTVEIEDLTSLGPVPAAVPVDRRLLLVLVESRLLETLPGSGEAAAVDLRPALTRYAADLERDGWCAWTVAARLYAGDRHQDGWGVLALRRLFQRLRETCPAFAGAVLVGSFPEAFVVRSYNWRNERTLTLNEGKPEQEKFEKPVPILRTIPEPVALRCELVLCDLDGRWPEVYVERRERLASVVGVYPGGVPPRGGLCSSFERSGVEFEDFFYVNDGRCDVREVLGPRRDGTTGEEVVALDLQPLDEYENSECAPADLALPNPLARPDIVVSRINPRGIALRPRPDVKGTQGEGLLGADGRPRAVAFADEKQVPGWIDGVWERDPLLERQVLAEYFERNHRFRLGEYAAAFKPAAIGFELGNGFDQVRQAAPEWREFAEPGYDGGSQATLLDLVEWLRRPAVVRDVRAHSDPWGSTFGACDLEALTRAAGGQPWIWSREGSSLVPSLQAGCGKGKADFALYRTLWQNRALPEAACFYFHNGCEGIAPPHAMDRPYNHPRYGFWQGAESLLFYVQGLALVGRAKVFYDEPRGFYEALAEGLSFGEAWARYFEIESKATNVDEVGGGIGRKRAYFWSVLGDWTLRLRKPGVG